MAKLSELSRKSQTGAGESSPHFDRVVDLLCREKEIFFNQHKKEQSCSLKKSGIFFHIKDERQRHEIGRILGNLIQNSFEAKASIIEVRCYEEGQCAVIEVLDDGEGLSEDILSKLGKVEVSSKPDGHDIGLYESIKYLNQLNGDIEFLPHEGGGARVKVRLPRDLIVFSRLVLLDNDPLVSMIWKIAAAKAKINFLFFSDLDEFKKEFPIAQEESSVAEEPLYDFFFLDNDLGADELGMTVGERMRERGALFVTLCTGHSELNTTLPLQGKDFPFNLDSKS